MTGTPTPVGVTMVGVAQLVEHLVVVQGAAGSSPVTHPVATPVIGSESDMIMFLGS